jgi:hypothetical protein
MAWIQFQASQLVLHQTSFDPLDTRMSRPPGDEAGMYVMARSVLARHVDDKDLDCHLKTPVSLAYGSLLIFLISFHDFNDPPTSILHHS